MQKKKKIKNILFQNFPDPSLSCNALCFCRKVIFKKHTVKKMKSTSCDDDLVLMFLNKKKKKQRFNDTCCQIV